MAIFRVDKNGDYTVMSNYHLREKEMSLKAIGLLSKMLSLPDNWDYSLSGLVAICKENESAIKTTLQELKDFGYLEIVKKYPQSTDTGRIEYEYIVYEKPKQEGKKQEVENQPLEIQPLENHTQLNTNILNTNESNTNVKEKVKREMTPPTIDEVQEYIKEKQLNVDGQKFFDYFVAGNWIDAKGNKVKNWKQKIITWNSYTKPKEERKEQPKDELNKVHEDKIIDYSKFYWNG